MASELLKRSEVREEDTWKTSDMYENTGAWENELKEISALVDKAAAFEGKAAENADNLFVVLETLAKAGEKIEKAFNYAERLFDEDQTNRQCPQKYILFMRQWEAKQRLLIRRSLQLPRRH